MDFGPHTVQIFISLIVVLAAAGVALVCDLLKGNNEHLRELAVELKVRNEEAERRIEMAEKRGKRIPDLSGLRPVIASVSAPASAAPRIEVPRIEEPAELPRVAPTHRPRPAVAAATTAP